jgi:mono/diheme cytochrome c family protein
MRRPAAPQAALAVLALAAAACGWSVPADPGENARQRTRQSPALAPSPQATVAAPRPADAATQALYAQKCGACHAPFSPAYASASEWPTFVRRYGPRAGLFGADRARVLAWLQDHAR